MVASRSATLSFLLVALVAGSAAAELGVDLANQKAAFLKTLPPAIRAAAERELDAVASIVHDPSVRGRALAETDDASCSAGFGGVNLTSDPMKLFGDSVYGIMFQSILGAFGCMTVEQAKCNADYVVEGFGKGLCEWNSTNTPAGCGVAAAKMTAWESNPSFKKHVACAAHDTNATKCATDANCAMGPSIIGQGNTCQGNPDIMVDGMKGLIKVAMKQQIVCAPKAKAECLPKGCKYNTADSSCEASGDAFPEADVKAACPNLGGLVVEDGYVVGISISGAASKSTFFAVVVAVAVAFIAAAA